MHNLSNPTSSTSTPLPVSWVERLLQQMLLTYGKKFTDQWGATDTDELIDFWAAQLAGYSGGEIARGIKALDTRDWPPTLPEFKKLCRPPVDALAAYYEALAGLEARGKGEAGTWSHAAIYWAANSMRRELLSSGYAQIKERWAITLKAQLDMGTWADIPEPRTLLSAPAAPASREQAEQALQAIGATGVVNRRVGDPLGWAHKVLARAERGEAVPSMSIRFAKEALGIPLEAA